MPVLFVHRLTSGSTARSGWSWCANSIPGKLRFERDVEFRPDTKMAGINVDHPHRYRRVVVRPVSRDQSELDLEEAAKSDRTSPSTTDRTGRRCMSAEEERITVC